MEEKITIVQGTAIEKAIEKAGRERTEKVELPTATARMLFEAVKGRIGQ